MFKGMAAIVLTLGLRKVGFDLHPLKNKTLNKLVLERFFCAPACWEIFSLIKKITANAFVFASKTPISRALKFQEGTPDELHFLRFESVVVNFRMCCSTTNNKFYDGICEFQLSLFLIPARRWWMTQPFILITENKFSNESGEQRLFGLCHVSSTHVSHQQCLIVMKLCFCCFVSLVLEGMRWKIAVMNDFSKLSWESKDFPFSRRQTG